MNSCILMAEIIQEPQLRYTSDNQTPVAEMLVQFSGIRDDDPPSTLKVVGWGNLAQEIQAQFHEGDRVIVEGRININTIDRPEGFKEKRAELTAQRIHRLGGDATLSTSTATPAATLSATPTPVTPAPAAPPAATPAKSTSSRSRKTAVVEPTTDTADYDDIPF